MKKEDVLVFCLGWVAANTPQLVALLHALLPVLAVGVVGYAMYVTRRGDKGSKHD